MYKQFIPMNDALLVALANSNEKIVPLANAARVNNSAPHGFSIERADGSVLMTEERWYRARRPAAA